LMDHELIGNPKPNPQRVPHIHSQDEDPPNHEQSTRVANCDLRGEGSRTPHKSLGEARNNL